MWPWRLNFVYRISGHCKPPCQVSRSEDISFKSYHLDKHPSECCAWATKILDKKKSKEWKIRAVKLYHHHTTTVLRPFFRDRPGEPAPEENFWTLWCKGRLTEADTPTIRLDATPSGLTSAHLHQTPHIFYTPDALPAAQPTASKHWRQLAHSDKGNTLEFSSSVLPAPSPYLNCKAVELN